MAEDGKTMQEIARTDYPGVSALEQDQQVAVLAIRQDLDTIPVVDPQTKPGRLAVSFASAAQARQ